MGMLSDISDAIESYNGSVEKEVRRVRTDPKAAKEVLDRWQQLRASIPTTTTPTGIKLPRLALPDVDEPGEITRFVMGEGLPGEFPFVNSAYRELYLEPMQAPLAASHNGNGRLSGKSKKASRNGKNGHNDVGGAA